MGSKEVKMKRVLVGAVLLGVSFASWVGAETWYTLDEDETYVADFLLPAGESKTIIVESLEPVEIGFESDVSGVEAYRELRDKYGMEIIQFRDVNGGMTPTTISGGSMT
jgi:hypothetical protein